MVNVPVFVLAYTSGDDMEILSTNKGKRCFLYENNKLEVIGKIFRQPCGRSRRTCQCPIQTMAPSLITAI